MNWILKTTTFNNAIIYVLLFFVFTVVNDDAVIVVTVVVTVVEKMWENLRELDDEEKMMKMNMIDRLEVSCVTIDQIELLKCTNTLALFDIPYI